MFTLKNVDRRIMFKLVLRTISSKYFILRIILRNAVPWHIITKLERSWIDNYLVYSRIEFHKFCNHLKMIKHTTITNELYFLDQRINLPEIVIVLSFNPPIPTIKAL